MPDATQVPSWVTLLIQVPLVGVFIWYSLEMSKRGAEAQKAFDEDKKWIDWADVVFLLLPAGKSSHLEAGYAKGQGKKLVIFQENFPKGEFDVMYGFADLITNNMSQLVTFLENEALRLDERKKEIERMRHNVEKKQERCFA